MPGSHRPCGSPGPPCRAGSCAPCGVPHLVRQVSVRARRQQRSHHGQVAVVGTAPQRRVAVLGVAGRCQGCRGVQGAGSSVPRSHGNDLQESVAGACLWPGCLGSTELLPPCTATTNGPRAHCGLPPFPPSAPCPVRWCPRPGPAAAAAPLGGRRRQRRPARCSRPGEGDGGAAGRQR